MEMDMELRVVRPSVEIGVDEFLEKMSKPELNLDATFCVCELVLFCKEVDEIKKDARLVSREEVGKASVMSNNASLKGLCKTAFNRMRREEGGLVCLETKDGIFLWEAKKRLQKKRI